MAHTMYVWKENIFMAHVSLAPASTPVDRHPLLFWATVALAISALVHWRPLLLTGARRSASHRRPAPGAHHSTSHWQPSICWQLTFHIIFVAGKLLYGLCRRRSRCTFTHCMFSRNVFLPPASRPVHRHPLLFWPPAPVDLLLKVVAHNCCP